MSERAVWLNTVRGLIHVSRVGLAHSAHEGPPSHREGGGGWVARGMEGKGAAAPAPEPSWEGRIDPRSFTETAI